MSATTPIQTTSLKAAALHFAAQGIAVFPLGTHGERRKKPLIKDGQGYKDATIDEAQIRAWWNATPCANIGRPTGGRYGALVIDVDPRHDGPASLAKLKAKYGPLPARTHTVRSGAGGDHLYFRHPSVFIKSKDNRFGDEYPGVDVKADGGYVVAPPSIHPNGTRYVVTSDAPLAELPQAWLDALLATQTMPLELETGALDGTEHYASDGKRWPDWALDKKRDGTSDFYGQQLAIQLLVNRVSDPEPVLREYAVSATYDTAWPFDDRDIARWLRSAEQARIVRVGQPARNPNASASRAPSAKQSAEQPKMPIDALFSDWASMGILDETGHLRQGFIEVATVQVECVRWLWQGRIPMGKLTVIDGDPDLGKSLLFGADMPARVTTGSVMPDGTPGLGEPAGVVILSAEDDVADTIRPRLDAAGADVSRILAIYSVPRFKTREDGTLEAEEGSFTIPRDLDWLRAAISHKGAKYVLIDPLMAYLHPDETNSYRDQDVRTALAPLARLAADTGAAIVVIRHLNKSGAANPLYRGGGSIGIIGAARSALLVAADPDDPDKQRRILARIKGNLAAPVPALAYHIEVTEDNVPFIAWEGETEHTAAQLLAAYPVDAEAKTETDEAVGWLRSVLENAGGQAPAKVVQGKARDEGISDKVLRSARLRICAKPTKEGFGSDGGWLWKLAPAPASKMPSDPKMPIDALYPNEGVLEDRGHLSKSDYCPKSPTWCHVYAKMRTADGRRVCIECDEPEGAKEAS